MPTARVDRSCRLSFRLTHENGASATGSFHLVARFGKKTFSGYVHAGERGAMSFTITGVLPPDTPGSLQVAPGKMPYGLKLTLPAASRLPRHSFLTPFLSGPSTSERSP